VQTEQKRTCAACGADNTPQAGFCWQCYSPFAPAAPRLGSPSMPPTPGAARPFAPADAPAPAPASRGRAGLIVRIAAGVVVAIVVSTLVRNMLTPTYHVPETLAGEPRLHTADTQQFEQAMAEQGDKYDIEFEAAVYGQGEQPDVFLVLANGHAEESADELFNDFLSGVESAGVTVDRSRTVTGEHGDAEYRCVPVEARIQAVACVWREDRSVGMTLDGSPDTDLTSTLFAAYDATHV
jgi:hypothetical protein